MQSVLEHLAAHWFVGPTFAALTAEGICKCSVCFLYQNMSGVNAVTVAMLMVIQFVKTLHCIIVQFVNNVDSNTSIIKPLLFYFSLQFTGWTS